MSCIPIEVPVQRLNAGHSFAGIGLDRAVGVESLTLPGTPGEYCGRNACTYR